MLNVNVSLHNALAILKGKHTSDYSAYALLNIAPYLSVLVAISTKQQFWTPLAIPTIVVIVNRQDEVGGKAEGRRELPALKPNDAGYGAPMDGKGE